MSAFHAAAHLIDYILTPFELPLRVAILRDEFWFGDPELASDDRACGDVVSVDELPEGALADVQFYGELVVSLILQLPRKFPQLGF